MLRISRLLASSTAVGAVALWVSCGSGATFTGNAAQKPATASAGPSADAHAQAVSPSAAQQVPAKPAVPPLSCTLVAAATSITSGGSTTLTMSTTGAVTASSVSGQLSVTLDKPFAVSPTTTTTYTGTVEGPEGTSTCKASVAVNAPPAPACTLTPATVSLAANAPVTLTLAINGDATSAMIGEQVVDLTGGTATVSSATSEAVSATVAGPGGTVTCTSAITIVPAPTCTLSASPTTVTQGQSVELTLATAGKPDTALIAGQAVAAGGGQLSVTPQGPTTYLGTVTGTGGSTTCSAPVNVLPPPPPNINFGLLANDLNCTFCHLEVHGPVVSVTTVPAFRDDSHGSVYGNWLVAGDFDATQGSKNLDGGLTVTGTLTPNYNNSGHELPVDGSGNPAFPAINFSALSTKVQGTITNNGAGAPFPASVTQVYAGNLLLIGTDAQPLVINRDVLVQGDVIIKGVYTGVGTIYATGNIYIPANLRSVKTPAYPYPDPVNGDASAADAQAAADIKAGKDALGLASAHNIFIADLENYMDSSNGPTGVTGIGGAAQYVSLYDYGSAGPLLTPRSSIGIETVYTWYPEAQYEGLYESLTPCWTASNRALVAGHHWGERAVNRIDAFLYAASAIGGVSRATNWTINGGMVAQVMHVISGAGWDSVAANSQCGASSINFDYRMRNGLQLLEALDSGFAKH